METHLFEYNKSRYPRALTWPGVNYEVRTWPPGARHTRHCFYVRVYSFFFFSYSVLISKHPPGRVFFEVKIRTRFRRENA